MNAWKTQTIADLGKVVTGKTPPSANPDQFGDKYPFITPTDIEWGAKFAETERALSEKGRDAHHRILLPENSVCVVCIASIGKVCLTTEDSVTNQQINSIIVDCKKHDPDFVFYIASLLRSTLEAYAGGAATPIVNKSAFSKIKLQVPELPIQRKIAAILTAYDDLIETNKRRIALLEKMAEELYREWFVRMRFPGHQNTRFVKGVPEGWEMLPSNQIFDVRSGGTPKTDTPQFWDGSIPFFTPKDAPDHIYVGRTEKWITEKGLNSCNSPLYPKNTIFITARGTVGKLALSQCDMAMNQSCYALVPKFDQEVYFFYLSMLNAITVVKGVSKSGVFDNIIVDTFKIIPIYFPGEILVKAFNEIVHPIFTQIDLLLSANENLTKTRDLLLPRLISGKLSVENLDIQFPPSMQEETPESESAYAELHL